MQTIYFFSYPPLSICLLLKVFLSPGTYREDETRSDVDHEFVAMFFIPYERDTWYFWENLEVEMLESV